jgi:hypothetical protein
MPSEVNGIVPFIKVAFRPLSYGIGQKGFREALETDDRVTVTCPRCAKMLTDVMKAEEAEGKLEGLGIGEILRRGRAK